MKEDTINVVDLQGSKREAFDRLYRLYFNSLYRFAYHFIMSPEAEDLVQEVFIKLYEKRMSLPENVSLKSYLYAATKNACINYLRHLGIHDKNKSKLVEAILFSAGHDYEEEEEVAGRVEACIAKLSTQQQLVLRLHAEGMSYQQIAEKLNVSVGTINTHVNRAYAYFRKFFTLVLSFFS
ncbi:MAG: RNA polymerase sigma-70 factor [Odoribacteraceae bacterium]|jgi:RNA polymerase sigma-70 factor (ECF subfamily)|nr:RNA polymerase sigma-70 factor [Odoribacteraceae bacterium]